jgi:hypothetical protein
MSLPDPKHNGLLPPFSGEAESSARRSPYDCTARDLVARYAVDHRRIEILAGYLAVRRYLPHFGLSRGYHWISGSFVDGGEKPPRDVDVVHFVDISEKLEDALSPVWGGVLEYFHRELRVDYSVVNLLHPVEDVVDQATYYFDLFSHTKETFEWRGMPKLYLDEDLTPAKRLLIARGLLAHARQLRCEPS